MKKFTALALALSAIFSAHAGGKKDPMEGVTILGHIDDILIYDKDCLSVVNKGEKGSIAVRWKQAACVFDEGKNVMRIEWISTGKFERINGEKFELNDFADPKTKDEILARYSGNGANAIKAPPPKPADLDNVSKMGVANGNKVYDKECMGGRGSDGNVTISSINGSRGCLIGEGGDMWRIDWENGRTERVVTLTVTDLANSAKQIPMPVKQPPVTGTTRQDLNRSLNAPRYDEYGRPLKSTAELCAEAQRMGGPVTQKCAWERWSR